MNPAVTSTLKNAAGSAVGIIQKALLIIHMEEKPQTGGLASMASKTATALKTAGSGLKATGSALSNAGLNTKMLEVQYNPSSITLTANSDAIFFDAMQTDAAQTNMATQNVRNPSVVMTVELIFDAMNPKDAFMFDKLRLSVGDAVSAVSGLVQAGKGGYTVQPQTNGLLAALIRNNTRCVTFRWADMAFTGELTEASATYTMFSVSGKPVRSKVRLSITQQVEKPGDITYWENAYTKAFTAPSIGGRSLANRVGNLLNIGF